MPAPEGALGLWVHPATHTVASAIRLVAGRMRDAGNGTVNGCLVVPFQQHAAWWSLTRNFVFEGLLPPGTGLEENRLGSWVRLGSQSPAAIFSLSRRSGARVRPVHLGLAGLGAGGDGSTFGVPGYAFDARAPARWRRPLPVGALVMARGAGGAWRLYSVREPYDELGAREVQLAELEVGYFEIGSEQSVAHVAANDHAMTRVPATLPADGLYEVGGSLYSVAERPGRKGAVRQTIQMEWRLACRMADAAEAERGDLGGSVSEWPSASSGGSGRSAWTGVGRSLRSPLVFAAAADSPRSGATAAEPDTPYRPAPGERRVDSPPSMGDARVDDEPPAAGGEGDALDRLTAEVGAFGLDVPYLIPTEEEEAAAAAAQAEARREARARAEARAEAGARAEAARRAAAGEVPARPAENDDVRGAGYSPYAGPPQVPEKAVGQGSVRCRQRVLVCEGCDLHIDFGATMRQGKRGWVHDATMCYDSACAQHRARVAAGERRLGGEAAREMGRSLAPPAAHSEAGYTIPARKLALDNSYHPERLDAIVGCMRGECDCAGERTLQCARACGASLHIECAGAGKAAALGRVVCVDCRLADMKASLPASSAVERMAAKQLVLELLSRKESTARSNLDVERMQQHFLNEVLADGGTMAKPVDNAAAMVSYLFWIIESGRGSQLEGHVVKLGAYLLDTGRDSVEDQRFLLKEPVVARALKRVKELNPSEPLPMTSGTVSLAREILATIPGEAVTTFIAAREKALFSLECVGGARIGELAGAQVGHGVFANHLVVIKWTSSYEDGAGQRHEWPLPAGVAEGERFVEHDNETSKTGVSRVMCLPGTTTGPAAVPLADTIEEYWAEAGIEVDTVQEGGWSVQRPDFWVAQLHLLGLHRNAKKLQIVRRWFSASRVPQVRDRQTALGRELTRLTTSKDPSDTKMFLNVACGRRASAAVVTAMEELAALGVRAVIAPGPLFMKTVGSTMVDGKKKSTVMPMPLLVKSTYDFIGKVTKKAFGKLETDGGDPDLVLGKGRKRPRFAHHSWRRLADTTAEECLAAGKCTAEDIELHFGWRLKEYKKLMRLHYSDRGKRTARSKLVKEM